MSPGLRCFACECGQCAWCSAMSRSRGVIRAITVSSSSKRRAPLGGGTTGRKGKKHRKMGGKRHFEPVKRAEPRFPENPTDHSSPPARRRQKIAPLRHSSPPLRPSRPHRHLPTSFAHSVCLIPSPFFPIHHSIADTDPTMSNTTIHHSILFTFPDSSVFHLSLLRGIAVHNAPPPLPSLVDAPPQFVQPELWQNTQTAQSRHYSHHLNIFLRIVCRVFLLPQPPCLFAGRHYRSQASRMCSTRLT